MVVEMMHAGYVPVAENRVKENERVGEAKVWVRMRVASKGVVLEWGEEWIGKRVHRRGMVITPVRPMSMTAVASRREILMLRWWPFTVMVVLLCTDELDKVK